MSVAYSLLVHWVLLSLVLGVQGSAEADAFSDVSGLLPLSRNSSLHMVMSRGHNASTVYVCRRLTCTGSLPVDRKLPAITIDSSILC